MDDRSLSRRLRFEPDWDAVGTPTITDDDEYFVAIPTAAKSVAVQLLFIDGTESEIKTLSTSDAGLAVD